MPGDILGIISHITTNMDRGFLYKMLLSSSIPVCYIYIYIIRDNILLVFIDEKMDESWISELMRKMCPVHAKIFKE